MADRSRGRVPLRTLPVILLLVTLGGVGAAHAAKLAAHKRTSNSAPPSISFVAPVNGKTVGGSVSVSLTISTTPSPTNPKSVWWTHLSVDGAPVADGYNILPWNTTATGNGSHLVRVDGYAYNSTTSIANSSITVAVSNSTSTPVAPTATLTATAKPTVTATVTPTAKPTVTATVTPTAKPTVTATVTPTAAPTHTATPLPTLVPTPSPTPTSAPTPGGTTFYVAPTGSDSAAGTSSAPWRTIQKASDTLQAGQTAIVAAGNYGERVLIKRSGTQALPITLQVASSAKVQLQGFDVTGSNWVINGFDISTQTNGSDGIGVYVSGAATNDTIENSYIHELCHEGIFMDSGVSHITVLNNRIWRAEMAGVQADGTNDLIQGNEVWGTQQYPAMAGGIYAGCTIGGGADADAFRFFGQHNVFRSNYAHDIYTVSPTNPNPHTDCFQTWGSTAMKVDDILIERNTCRWPLASSAVDAETAMIEGVDGPIGTVTFQNNLLSNMRQGIQLGSNVAALKAYNNTWDHLLQEGLIFIDLRSPADEIINNIFYDVGGGGDGYAAVPSGSPTFEANDFYMPGGASVGTYPNVHPFMSVAPDFVSYGDATGANADFHLQPGSGLKDAGVAVPGVTNDFDGTSRGAGGYSVGATQ